MRKVQPNRGESEMAGEYDTVTRILLEHCGQDWLAALATIQRFPDRVFRLHYPQPYLLHLEVRV
jgi:hypothetical protein